MLSGSAGSPCAGVAGRSRRRDPRYSATGIGEPSRTNCRRGSGRAWTRRAEVLDAQRPGNAASSTGFCSYGLSTAVPVVGGVGQAAAAPRQTGVGVRLLELAAAGASVESGRRCCRHGAGTASSAYAPIVPVVAGATGARVRRAVERVVRRVADRASQARADRAARSRDRPVDGHRAQPTVRFPAPAWRRAQLVELVGDRVHVVAGRQRAAVGVVVVAPWRYRGRRVDLAGLPGTRFAKPGMLAR